MDKSRAENYALHRRDVAKTLLANRDDNFLVVTGLGSPNWDATNAGDHPLTFPLWGAMGGAVTIVLVLALAQPGRRVLVITGDGEMLMGMGSLATAAKQMPENLSICVFDNEHYGETGMQTTHTESVADLSLIAKGCGLSHVTSVKTEAELADVLPLLRSGPGLQFACIKVRAEKLDFALPPKDGVYLKTRFRQALLGREAV